MDLTDVKFWEDFWAAAKLPSTIDWEFPYDRCLADALKTHLSASRGEVLEIGCAPGKWLHFLAKELGLKPSGINYSEAGMRATEKNFQILQLTDIGFLRAGDFFQITPDRLFDVVMSLGFIEHLTDVDTVVEAHLRWVKPGGVLVLGVPNLRGIYAVAQRVLDQEILDKHNVSIMNLDFFLHLKRRFHLDPVFMGYIGSFEPELPIPKPRIDNPSIRRVSCSTLRRRRHGPHCSGTMSAPGGEAVRYSMPVRCSATDMRGFRTDQSVHKTNSYWP